MLRRHKQCPRGYDLHYDRAVRKYDCRCKKYHLYWPDDGLCYREYQQGPCPEGHRFVLTRYCCLHSAPYGIGLIQFTV